MFIGYKGIGFLYKHNSFENKMKIAIPNKGRLHEPSLELLKKAGLKVENDAPRRLIVNTIKPHIQVLFSRARDIPGYVEIGAAEMGITGIDLIEELNAKVVKLLDLNFGHASLVVAVPDSSNISTLEDLKGKRIATEFPNITRQFFDERDISVEVVEISGACETAPQIGISDAIVDLTSSGTTLAINRLIPLYTIMKTNAVLICNEDAYPSGEVREILLAIESVVRAEGMRYVMMNVPEEALEKIKQLVPGMKGPTVMKVEADEPIVAVHVVVHEDELFDTINKLKKAGARDILVTPIQRIVL
jgi:ATP phosphoribosyltransferase